MMKMISPLLITFLKMTSQMSITMVLDNNLITTLTRNERTVTLTKMSSP